MVIIILPYLTMNIKLSYLILLDLVNCYFRFLRCANNNTLSQFNIKFLYKMAHRLNLYYILVFTLIYIFVNNVESG